MQNAGNPVHHSGVTIFNVADSTFGSAAALTATNTILSNTDSNNYRWGMAFGPGNTFYGDEHNNAMLRRGSFDGTTFAATETEVYGQTADLPINIDAIDVDAAKQILAGFIPGVNSAQVRLYDISGGNGQPVLLDTDAFTHPNANQFSLGDVDFAGDRLYVLGTNNGIMAFSVVPEPASFGLLALAGVALSAARIRRGR